MKVPQTNMEESERDTKQKFGTGEGLQTKKKCEVRSLKRGCLKISTKVLNLPKKYIVSVCGYETTYIGIRVLGHLAQLEFYHQLFVGDGFHLSLCRPNPCIK